MLTLSETKTTVFETLNHTHVLILRPKVQCRQPRQDIMGEIITGGRAIW